MAKSGFRKQLMGFNRKDVIEYLDAMSNKTEKIKQENIVLIKENERLNNEIEKAAKEKQHIETENEKLKAVTASLKQELAQAKSEKKVQQSQNTPIVSVERADNIADTLIKFPKLCQEVLARLIK